ncbi:MAG: phosphonate C-P lyase system protein PhnH [Ruegeria sp.]
MEQTSLAGGFQDPPRQSAVVFRGIMTAMARPGTIQAVAGAHAPDPLSIAAATVVMTLCDPDTGIHLTDPYDTRSVRDWITFHTGAPIVKAADAQFVLGRWADIELVGLPIGTPEYPDRSATVIVEVPELRAEGATLTGPGIETQVSLNLPPSDVFQRNHALFPLGLDFMFTCGAQMAALPRSTKVS